MPKAYSDDLRHRVLAARDDGQSIVAVAGRFGVSESFVVKACRRRRTTGQTTAIPRGGRKPTWTAHAERLRAIIAEHPGATLAEIRQALGGALPIATLDRAIKRLGITRKKSRSRLPRPTGPTSPRPGRVGTTVGHRT